MKNQPGFDRQPLRDKLHDLSRILKSHAPLLIAYSGGVDSTFLLNEAARELGNGAARLAI